MLEALSEADTETRRLLRRGIPFGAPLTNSSLSSPAAEDEGDRGLLFLAYQTSFTRQFEFVIQSWVNDPGFKDPGAGNDPILGQANTQAPSLYGGAPAAGRGRAFRYDSADPATELQLPEDWVVAMGGAYLFSPSIDGLNILAGL